MTRETTNKARLLAVIAGSAFVALAAVGVAVGQDRAGGSVLSSEMSTGVTITKSAGPTKAELPQAVPDIKGPAPLPAEEQGLPG